MEKETNKIKLIACIDENGIIGKKKSKQNVMEITRRFKPFQREN